MGRRETPWPADGREIRTVRRMRATDYHGSTMHSTRGFGRALLPIALILILGACTTEATPTVSAVASTDTSGLQAASVGICAAVAALPDASAAERVFTNQAHGALHSLAAAPGLDREDAARLLEAMEQLETDFADATDQAQLGSDLVALQASADEALRALAIEVPACTQ